MNRLPTHLFLTGLALAVAATPTSAARTATHCKIGNEHKSSTSKSELVWNIVPITDMNQLASGAGSHYEIIEEFFSPAVTNPQLRLKKGELLFTTYNKGYVDLSHAKGAPATPSYISHSTLTRESVNRLWASGHAQLDATGGKRVGEFYAYLREDRSACKHKNVKIDATTGKKPPCHRLLLEYFDDSDKYSAGDRPEMNVNVFPIADPRCDGGLMETSDGEGDVGPN